ncbi:MAG: peptide deformylase [Cellulomonadaceae bacterium]|jgi:peptide deformylase|nr:peptide deformylase [Cellulomonadaceae bacterium]
MFRRGQKTYLNGKRALRYPEYAPESERGRDLRITERGEPVLHTPAAEITAASTPALGSPELATLIDDMFATMDVAQGVGLAAPQVGVGLRVFVYDVTDDDDVRHVGHVINPVLAVDAEVDPITDREGCLSVVGAYEDLERPGGASVTGVDRDGKPVRLEATGYLARAFIHECQHLDGVLYFDHLTAEQQADCLAQRDAQRATVLAERHEMALYLGKEPAVYP